MGDWNTACGTASGFYMGNGLSNSPAGTTVGGWWWIIHIVHNDKYQRQIAYSFLNNDEIYTRIMNNGTWNSWTPVGEAYSINEIKTGKTYKDGKPIYKKDLEYSVPNTGTTTFNHNLSIDTVINISAKCTISGQTVASHGYRPMPQSASGSWFGINAITTNQISFLATYWQNNKAYITLEYTKTTD
jgi:hypothetical protein